MIKPKCLPPGKKELAYTATGYIVPCCWVDCPEGWKEPQIKRLYQNKLKVSNNKDIESIVNSTEWNEFFEELKTNYCCQQYYSRSSSWKVSSFTNYSFLDLFDLFCKQFMLPELSF